LLINAHLLEEASRTTLPVAGDDTHAKQAVMRFMNAIGYNAIDAGSLADSWRIEP
jgi:predicted dinucleotide-binding enzyme